MKSICVFDIMVGDCDNKAAIANIASTLKSFNDGNHNAIPSVSLWPLVLLLCNCTGKKMTSKVWHLASPSQFERVGLDER